MSIFFSAEMAPSIQERQKISNREWLTTRRVKALDTQDLIFLSCLSIKRHITLGGKPCAERPLSSNSQERRRRPLFKQEEGERKASRKRAGSLFFGSFFTSKDGIFFEGEKG